MLKNGSQYLYYATQLIGAATCNRLHFPEFSLQTLAQPSSDKNPHFWVCQWESVSISHGGSVNSYCFVLELMGPPPPPHTHTPGMAQFNFSNFLRVPWVPSVVCPVPRSSGALKATTTSSKSSSGIYQWAEILFKTWGVGAESEKHNLGCSTKIKT